MTKRPDRQMAARVRIRNVGDLFDFLTRLEDVFEQYYSSIRDSSGDNNACLLSYYLGRRYRRLRLSLKDFIPQKASRIRKNKLRLELEIVTQEWISLIALPPEKITGRELLDSAIKYNRKLLAIYRNVLGQALTKDAFLLLSKLAILEETDCSNLNKMLAMHYF